MTEAPGQGTANRLDETTRLLQAARQGDAGAADGLYRRVYSDLRRIAHAQLRRHGGAPAFSGLGTTALIHEAYLKLADVEQLDARDRAHFLSLSARAMRQVLVDHYRHRTAKKRGDGAEVLPLTEHLVPAPRTDRWGAGDRILALDEALGRLADEDPRAAKVVECRFFAGMSYDEIGSALGIAARSARRDWAKAKDWLAQALGEDAAGTARGAEILASALEEMSREDG